MECKEATNLLIQTTNGRDKGNKIRPVSDPGRPVRALITGATSGIGKAFATELAVRGCDLVLTGRRSEPLSQVTAQLGAAHGVSVQSITGDLTSRDVEQLVVDAVKAGPLDYLVNNAGSGLSEDFHEAGPEMLDELRELLSGVPGRLTRAALPAMIEAGRGTVINVGSLAGRISVPGSSVYVASKIYMERLSETLALELHRHGIVVQALTPGYVRTDFHRAVPDYKSKQRNRGVIRWLEPRKVVEVSMRAARRAHARIGRSDGLPRPRDVVVIPGLMNRFLNFLARFVPRRLLYVAAANRRRLE